MHKLSATANIEEGGVRIFNTARNFPSFKSRGLDDFSIGIIYISEKPCLSELRYSGGLEQGLQTARFWHNLLHVHFLVLHFFDKPKLCLRASSRLQQQLRIACQNANFCSPRPKCSALRVCFSDWAIHLGRQGLDLQFCFFPSAASHLVSSPPQLWLSSVLWSVCLHTKLRVQSYQTFQYW